MPDDKYFELLLQNIRDLKEAIVEHSKKLDNLPCQKHDVKINLMWNGFWGLVVGQFSLFVKILYDYFTGGKA
jgi:hypothetical protein